MAYKHPANLEYKTIEILVEKNQLNDDEEHPGNLVFTSRKGLRYRVHALLKECYKAMGVPVPAGLITKNAHRKVPESVNEVVGLFEAAKNTSKNK